MSLTEIIGIIFSAFVLFFIGYNTENLKRFLIAVFASFWIAIAAYTFLSAVFGKLPLLSLPILMFVVILGELYREKKKRQLGSAPQKAAM